MPRGRPTARSSGTPSNGKIESPNVSGSGSGRVTRSSSVRALSRSSLGDVNTPNSPYVPEKQKPIRGRAGRVSLQANRGCPAAEPGSVIGVAAPLSGRKSSRLSKVSNIGSESVSSARTTLEESSDGDYSTPGTSHVATPAVVDGDVSIKAQKNKSSIEVHLPSRTRQKRLNGDGALRNSIQSLKPMSKQKQQIIDDSDQEDDDFSDHSLGATVARKLQEEEYAKSMTETLPPLPSRRQSRRASAKAASSSPVRTKRARGLTVSSSQRGRPQKKTKVIPDSEDPLESDIDIDAEIAAADGLNIGELGNISTEDEIDDSFDESDVASEEEYVPDVSVKAGRSVTTLKPLPKPMVARTSRTAARSGAANASTNASNESSALSDVDSNADISNPLAMVEDSDSSLNTSANVNFSTPNDSSNEEDAMTALGNQRRAFRRPENNRRHKKERDRLEKHHPEIVTMWTDLEQMPVIKAGIAVQPTTISRQLKPFQLEGLAWMKAMEAREWKGGLLGDEMGLGKTIQAVSLIMSDYPAKQPSLVLVPPVALMQWQSEIKSYTDGTLKTFVYHGTNQKTKGISAKELKKYDIIMMSYNSLESMYRKQERGFKRKDGIHKERSVIHSITFHRAILDEAHCIKTRTTMTAKACFALKTTYRWCLTGTPLQNRIGEFFSLIRFLNIRPFAEYLCKQCPCSQIEWTMDEDNRCKECNHPGMQHVSVFNQELLNPIQKFGHLGPGKQAFNRLRLMTDRIMLRRLKKDHTDSMELPVKEIYVDRQFFGEEENDFANSIMTNGQRKFDTYVAQGVLLNNYANIFGLIMQMRQVADHPDLLLKKNAEGGQNILVCCICDEPSEDTIRSRCKHDFCRACVSSYLKSTDTPDCPRCHIPLSIDLEQPEIEQDETLVKKSSIINRIKMENWTSSSKIELLVHELHKLRSDNASHKSIIFSQFTTMLQLIEWRLRRAGITTVMLDGSMTPAQRQASIEHFMNNVDVECFLVSLKAGGVALNLTEASRVFIVDPWWNPAAEWQSADRCHRIGQTRPCTITRLCIEDSVESRMVLIQEKKTNMINSTVNADDKAMASLTPDDMQFLFRGS